jgi:hypothetical protein
MKVKPSVKKICPCQAIEPPHLPLTSRGSLVRFQLRPPARKTRSRYLLGSIQRDLKIA